VKRLEEELEKHAVCQRFYSSCTALYCAKLYLTNEALETFGDFRIGGKVNRTMKYADDLLLLAKEATVLQGFFDRLKFQDSMEWK
jgi:hypothetical protein